MVERAEFLEFVRGMLGTPFHHQARVSGVGIDCVGVILVPLWNFGLTNIDIRGYSRHPNPEQLYEHAQKMIDGNVVYKVPTSDRMPGDIALFRIKGEPRHFGWLTDVGVLHAQYSNNPRAKAVVEHSIDRDFTNSIIQVYRVRGIE